MHLHLLGIGGTFMAGVAVLATKMGHEVTGSDLKLYPPMSTQLIDQNITVFEGYDPAQLDQKPDVIIIGNALKRGNPMVEYILNENIPFISAPQWLDENLLKDRHVLAVAGTHGKTTTASILTWILEVAGLNPGFLIGGIPKNFGVSACLGKNPFFVIEADEYDTAFFDKRSKFLHYHPRTLILNNLEFDHADIFSDLAAIQTQFHHLVRTVPSQGRIICNSQDENLKRVLEKGCWSEIKWLSGQGEELEWECVNKNEALLGQHNIYNALFAMAAAEHVGVSRATALQALKSFQGVKRRLEKVGEVKGAVIYEDFAHHPTAIQTTLEGLRKKIGHARLIAVIELGSYTMRAGVHRDTLKTVFDEADHIIFLKPEHDWGVEGLAKEISKPSWIGNSVEQIAEYLSKTIQLGDQVVIMSNTGFSQALVKRMDISPKQI